MLSPVWTPIGSKFSMLQIVMQASELSRMTSYSISFPADEAALNQDLMNWTGGKTTVHDPFIVGFGFRDAAAGAAEGVGRPDNER